MAKANKEASFSADERAAMKERQRELKSSSETEGEGAIFAKIDTMPEPDKSMARRIHELVTTAAPGFTSRTWYGMPAYCRDGQVVCFFQAASKFKARYGTLGFTDKARLDDGEMWPTYFAVTKLTPTVEKQITALVRQAVG